MSTSKADNQRKHEDYGIELRFESRKFIVYQQRVSLFLLKETQSQSPIIESTFYFIMNMLCVFLGLTTFSMAYGELDLLKWSV